MASIQRASKKPAALQKPDDQSRIMAGHMLTFDYLVQRDMSEKQTARKVVRKNVIRSAGCLTLPLTMLYFGSYVTSLRLHEDIVNVFFLESGMRMRTDSMFIEANSVEDVWDALLSTEPRKFIDTFFPQKDISGNVEPANFTADYWGPRGLVSGYNQIQGAMLFTQTRASKAVVANDSAARARVFGKPFNCTDELTCQLCRANNGFQTVRSYAEERPMDFSDTCGNWSSSRRLDSEAEDEEAAAARRLHLIRPEMKTSFPPPAAAADEFRFWLYPSESADTVRARLRYFKERDWVDQDTQHMTIKMYIMNAEMGRTRLEQLTLKFYFSHAGSIYYERDIHAIFLALWYGMMSMGADFSFFCLLFVTTVYRLHGMWRAFLNSRLYTHLMSLGTAWEWLLILVGWWNIYGFWNMMIWEANVLDKLAPVHAQGWNIGPNDEAKLLEFFEAATEAATGVSGLRVIYAQYSVVLMFRFFVSFGTQPRLAIVLKTMRNVMTDVFHFLFVFLPTFVAYVISASLMFGRRVEDFATVQGAFGAVFRIAMESEYEWGELSEQYFWAAALWAWSFMLLVVLLFLNMVVAIILDIYNETREGSFPGEAIWASASGWASRMKRFRTWVKDEDIEKFLAHEIGHQAIVTRKDLEERFETMPEKQKDLFFKSCRTEMKWESAKDLSKKSLLRLTGIVMDGIEDVDVIVKRNVKEGSGQPLKTWTEPLVEKEKKKEEGETEGVYSSESSRQKKIDKRKKEDPGGSSFLDESIVTKGGKQPMLTPMIGDTKDTYSTGGPEWLQEAWSLLKQQRSWITYANWNLEQMQYQIQKAHDSKAKRKDSGGANGAKVL